MRNSEARRYARWSLAAAGLLAAAVAGVYVRNVWVAHQAAKKAPPAVPPTVEQRSNEFSFSKVEGQRTIYTVRASRATEFKEGSRSLLEDVDIAVYGKKGDRNDTLRTRACDFIAKTGKISCAGEVAISLRSAGAAQADANAIAVATSAITFDRDSGAARSDKKLSFEWPGGKGSAVGVNYDSNSGTLRLAHAVDLTLSPSAAALAEKTGAAEEKAVHVSGNSMLFQREARSVLLKGEVHARQAGHELSAQRLLLQLDAAFHAKRMVAGGHPQLHDLNPQGPLALSADEMVSALRPDGSIESVAASGHVRGTRNTPAGGDAIDAGRIQMDCARRNNAPQLLTASKGVTLASTSASQKGGTRHVESDALEIHFSNPVTGPVTGGSLPPGQNAIESVNTLAPARVDWQNIAIVKGKPVAQTMRMAGKRLDLKFQAGNRLQELAGTGGVTVTRKLGDAPDETTASRELTAKFDDAGEWTAIDQTGDVHFTDGKRTGQGDRARVDRATNGVTLDGNVVFADAATRTTAQSASFDRAANTLRADGHVLTTETRPSASVSNLAQEPAHISAEHLVVDTARGHAVYSGKGRMWQGQSVIEGDTIELDSLTHSLVAKGQVHGVFPAAAWNPRQADAAGQPAGNAARPQLGSVRGGLLTYWEGESRARIEQGAEVDTEQGSIQADRIDLYFSGAGADNSTKQLSRAEANGDVVVRQEDRRGTSGRAEYTASEGKFVLSEGNPTLYSSTGDTTTGRQLTFFFADDRIVVDSADGVKTVTLHQVEK